MNTIHSTVIIEGDVRMGVGNQILPFTIIYGPVEIGDNNIIGPNVVIGTPGQDTRNPRYDSKGKRIRIGNNNIIREFTAIQKPAFGDITEVGSDVYIMQSVHIPHDAVIEDQAVITPMCGLAGMVRVMRGANIAIGASVQQYCVIGPYSIAGMGAPVLKNIRPFSRYIPGKPVTSNDYAIQKNGFQNFKDEIDAYVLTGQKPTSETIRKIVEDFERYQKISKLESY
jgi:UDP-N-acetylglucosamine acyltransferase